MRLLLPSDGDPSQIDQRPVGPWVRASMVVSLDGVIAVDGESAGLSGPADRAVYRVLREQADAVIVGSTTADHPGYGRLRRPLVIVSRTGAVRSHAQSTIVVTTRRGAERVTSELPDAEAIIAGEDQVDLALARTRLLDRGFESLLCEGGPTLLHAMLDSSLVDEICLTIAPRIIGEGPRLVPGHLAAPPMQLSAAAEECGWLFARYLVQRDSMSVGD